MIWPFKKKAPVQLWYPPCNSEFHFGWVDNGRPCPACLEKREREDDALAARIRTHKTIHGDADLVEAIVKGVVAGMLEVKQAECAAGVQAEKPAPNQALFITEPL